MKEECNEMFPCDKCKGEGKFLVPGKKIDEETFMAVFKICDKCRGEGKLDWIEMALGGKKNTKPTDIYEDDLMKMLEPDDFYEDDEEVYPAKPRPIRVYKAKKK